MSQQDDELDRLLGSLGNPAGSEPLMSPADILARALPPPPPPPTGLAGTKLVLAVVGSVTAGFVGGALVVGGLMHGDAPVPKVKAPEVAPLEAPAETPPPEAPAGPEVATGSPGTAGGVGGNPAFSGGTVDGSAGGGAASGQDRVKESVATEGGREEASGRNDGRLSRQDAVATGMSSGGREARSFGGNGGRAEDARSVAGNGGRAEGARSVAGSGGRSDLSTVKDGGSADAGSVARNGGWSGDAGAVARGRAEGSGPSTVKDGGTADAGSVARNGGRSGDAGAVAGGRAEGSGPSTVKDGGSADAGSVARIGGRAEDAQSFAGNGGRSEGADSSTVKDRGSEDAVAGGGSEGSRPSGTETPSEVAVRSGPGGDPSVSGPPDSEIASPEELLVDEPTPEEDLLLPRPVPSTGTHLDISVGLNSLPPRPDGVAAFGMLASVDLYHGFKTSSGWTPEVGGSLELVPRADMLPSALVLRAGGGVGYRLTNLTPSLDWTVAMMPVSWSPKKDKGAPEQPNQEPAKIGWLTGPVLRVVAGPANSVKLDAQVGVDLGFHPEGVETLGRLALGVSVPLGKVR